VRGFSNIEFTLGDIEQLPISDNTADVIVSNCVINLVPNKARVFKEIFRVLKSDGHFCISDIVLVGELPNSLRGAADMYGGCVAGAIQKDEYLQLIEESGFMSITIQKEHRVSIPDVILKNCLSEEELHLLEQSGAHISSITVYAEKSCCGSFALTCQTDC
jgi:SAM-dependent methyltransferase